MASRRPGVALLGICLRTRELEDQRRSWRVVAIGNRFDGVHEGVDARVSGHGGGAGVSERRIDDGRLRAQPTAERADFHAGGRVLRTAECETSLPVPAVVQCDQWQNLAESHQNRNNRVACHRV